MNSDQPRGAARKVTEAKIVTTQDLYQASWAVVIGINEYQDQHPRLKNARNDAQAVANMLEAYGFEQVITLYDEQATQDTILEWLRDNLRQQTGPNDRVVIFFAGHGTTDTASGSGYLIPYGARREKYSDYIDMDELRKACLSMPAKHVLIVLDCCFSGVAAIASRATVATPPKRLNDAYLQRITGQKAWQILTAGDTDDLVADSGARPGHSAFTSALLEGLEGNADKDIDGIITASDLAFYVKPQVTRHASGSTDQMPFFNYLAGSQQGDFVLLKPGQEIRVLPESTWQQQLPPVMQRNPWLVWVVGLVILILIIALGWFASRPGGLSEAQIQATQDKMMADFQASFYVTATQEAKAREHAIQTTLTAVAYAPEPTQTAVVQAMETEQVASATAGAEALATGQAAIEAGETIAPTKPPTPTPTVPPTETLTPPPPTSTPTPNRAATAAVIQAQETRVAQTRVAETVTAVLTTCPDGPQGEFRDVWDTHKGRLGCPKQNEPTIYGGFAQQQFDNGFMFWSELPQDLILAVISDDNPIWYELRSWSFDPDGASCAADFTPEAGQVQPIRAFGGVWCDNPQIRKAIGWGKEEEHSIGGAVQEFDGGFIIRDEDQSKAYVFFRDTQTYLREDRP